MSRTYIKKTLCQKSKLKNNTTSLRPFTALHLAPGQIDIQSAENLAKTCFDTLCLDSSTTAKNKVEKVWVHYSKWLYKDTKEVVEGVELVTQQRQRCKAIG